MEVETPKNSNNFNELNSLNGLNKFSNISSTPDNYPRSCSSNLSSEAISNNGFSSLINPIVGTMNCKFYKIFN